MTINNKRTRLKHAIADALSRSPIALTRNDLLTRVKDDLHNGTAQPISIVLSEMKAAGDVESQPGNRWSITARGRANYSVLHDEEPDHETPETDTTTTAAPETHAPHDDAHGNPGLALEQDHTTTEALVLETESRDAHRSPALAPTPRDEADFIAQVVAKLSQRPAPTISNKADKLGVLNLMREHYGFINSDFETVLSDIIADLEQLEAA